ncbi:Uncharacterized protein QTN25_008871 [Entamoeba marina]
MDTTDKMNSDKYEMVLLAYPQSFDISSLTTLSYELHKKNNTVVPMEPSTYQNVVPLVSEGNSYVVSKPFVDGFQIVSNNTNFKEAKDEPIDFFHSSKEPKYHVIDWDNTTVEKKVVFPDIRFGHYNKSKINKDEKDKNEKKPKEHKEKHHKKDRKEKKHHKK